MPAPVPARAGHDESDRRALRSRPDRACRPSARIWRRPRGRRDRRSCRGPVRAEYARAGGKGAVEPDRDPTGGDQRGQRSAGARCSGRRWSEPDAYERDGVSAGHPLARAPVAALAHPEVPLEHSPDRQRVGVGACRGALARRDRGRSGATPRATLSALSGLRVHEHADALAARADHRHRAVLRDAHSRCASTSASSPCTTGASRSATASAVVRDGSWPSASAWATSSAVASPRARPPSTITAACASASSIAAAASCSDVRTRHSPVRPSLRRRFASSQRLHSHWIPAAATTGHSGAVVGLTHRTQGVPGAIASYVVLTGSRRQPASSPALPR